MMGDPYNFHIGGSDVSGIVYAVGEGVEGIAIGDEVVVHHGFWDPEDPWVKAGKDPMLAPSSQIWEYNTNFGSFGQFCIAQDHAVLPKAPHLTWEEAAAPTLVGTTANRMLFGWKGNEVQEGDVVLVWGGSGGLGTQEIQLANVHGATAVDVVSDDERGEYCKKLGAVGYINRKNFNHWGIPSHWTDGAGQKEWTAGCRAFGKAIWEVLGEKRNPDIVFEHPGEATIPTSIFVCEAGGMVMICAGTTGYSALVDLHYHWVRQKRFQGSHGSNDEQAIAYNNLVCEGKIDPSGSGTLHIGDLDGSSGTGNRNRWGATVAITLHDEGENLISGATINGSWSVGGDASYVTDSFGQCRLTRNNLKGNQVSISFTVVSIDLSGYTYQTGENHDPDADSDGTEITIINHELKY